MQNLFTLIGNFLESPSKAATSDGWPPVTEQELEQLKIIVNTLIQRKYQGGRQPVEVLIIDASRYESLGFNIPIPHNPTPEDVLAISNQLEMLNKNVTQKLDIATNLLKRKLNDDA